MDFRQYHSGRLKRRTDAPIRLTPDKIAPFAQIRMRRASLYQNQPLPVVDTLDEKKDSFPSHNPSVLSGRELQLFPEDAL
jgi:hypothetical protein